MVVASKNFTEQLVLGEVLAQQVEGCTGLPVTRRLSLGGTMLAHHALLSGEVDLYPEYTGTALMTVLEGADTEAKAVSQPASVLERLRAEYRKRWEVDWLSPLGFENTFAMAVPDELATPKGIRTLTDAARSDFPWRLGVGYEFEQRPDGLPGLLRLYPLSLSGNVRTMDLGLLYRAMEQGQVDMVAANSTDGMLDALGLTVLEDDQHFFPPYEAAVVVSQHALGRHPGLLACLDVLSGTISVDAMRQMNRRADEGEASVEEIARDFLRESGLGGPLERHVGRNWRRSTPR